MGTGFGSQWRTASIRIDQRWANMYMRKLTQSVVTGCDKAVVETPYGKIRGAIIEGTYVFRGIKYADAKRFHAPAPVASWTGTKPALVYGYVAPELNTPIAHDASYVPHFLYPQNENCQYLNIWTQHLDHNAKKPVMVWLHGGGWFSGSSVELVAYDGENLSKFGDVVVVSLNHRLGPLGFLDLSAYGAEYQAAKNAGLLDIIAALRWIHDSIAAFGGDPGNVTIMGQSGGGGKVMALQQSPLADGLYHRGIMQSGGCDARDCLAEDAQDLAERVVHCLDIGKQNIKKIKTVPYYDFARAVSKAIADWRDDNKGRRYMWGPVADGKVYLGHPLTHGFWEYSAHIPLIIGTCFGEFSGNADVHLAEGSKNKWTEQEVRALYERRYGRSAEAAYRAFAAAYPDKKAVDGLFLDRDMRPGVIRYVKERAAKCQASTFCYLFSLESSWNGGTVAWHNAEEPYMFHNAAYIESAYIPGVSEALQDQMSGAWVSFARTGDPNHRGLPLWKPSTCSGVHTMLFDRKCQEVVNHDGEFLSIAPLPLENKKNFNGSALMHAVYGARY